MAFGDAIFSTASGQSSIPETTKAAAHAFRGIAGSASIGTPLLQSPSNIDLIAFDVAAHRASTSAFQ
jgi:hypothetical protein